MKAFTLKDLIKIKNGRDHKQLNEGAIPILGSGGLMRYGDKAIYEKESILLPRKGSLSNIQFSNVPFWTVDTLYYTEVNTQLCNPFYLYNYLKILDLESLNSGTGVPSMTFDSYYNLSIKLPSLAIQNTVSSILWSIEKKIQLNTKLNDNLELLAKTLYDYWFVQFDFPDANGKPYKTSGGKMVWNEELKREIPLDWVDGTLESIGDIIGGSTPSKAIDNNFCYGEGIPWITPKDLSNNKGKKYITRGEYDVTERGLKEASLKIMPRGTVLLSSRAPIGYLAIARTNVTTNQGFKSFVPKSIFSSEYIFFTIQSLIPEIEANSSGSTFKEVSTSTLRTIKTIIPCNKVLIAFNNLIKPIFKKQDTVELENQQLASLRDWLLPMLMNGQVKTQD